MKRILIMLTIINIAAFSACKKDASTVLTQNASINNSAKTVDGSNLNLAIASYRITTALPTNDQLFHWTSGYLNVGDITFDGNAPLGNMMRHVHQLATENKTLNLLPSSANGTVSSLGSIELPIYRYTYPEFGVVLADIQHPGATGAAANPNLVLFLAGNLMRNDRNTPVEIRIGEPTGFSAILQDPAIVLGPQNYDVMLFLGLDGLTSNISANMIAMATVTNNIIIIAPDSNPELYQVVWNNFKAIRLRAAVNISPVVLPNTTAPFPVN